MITNDLVLIGGSDASPVCHVDVNAAMPGVNTEEGIDITKLFPTNAVRKDDRMVFWKMTWLPAGNHQGTETGLPYLTGDYEGGLAGQTGTMTGYENRVDFTRLRYYDGGWEFYLDAELNAWNTTQKWGKDTNGDGTITLQMQPKYVNMSAPGKDAQGHMFQSLGAIDSTVDSITVLSWSEGTTADNCKVNYYGGTATVTINTKTKEITKADYVMEAHVVVSHACIAVIRDKNATMDVTMKWSAPASEKYMQEKKGVTRA